LPKGNRQVPEISSTRAERPAEEMQRLFRQLGGKRGAGDKDQHLMNRAVQRMNRRLSGNDLVGPRRARTYWYGESADVPSVHMDLIRELTFVQPLEDAFDAVEAAERFLDGLRERLLDRVVGGAGNGRGHHPHGPARARSPLPPGGSEIHNSRSAVLAGGLTSSRRPLPAN
jgi:hypothetical protein